ncbi:hypothetical protein NEOLI_003471 [Neolecta irregularis DAH-3]|uniref:GmrSD restriction endonucleases N-terminal domain-containing protein n=1 Tax=Neolecta irregularis (strain DAH-3) TaxID=1198029 RepID=A0A1U7LR39_NEOID|nr:hypothetical protein NEOLI_003471 [Neolecta irregularis DAH-3]|eukprot:OLL24981.1 hypothetical protein NEOLI_003471 [Neolecta irregularis DAH-3]
MPPAKAQEEYDEEEDQDGDGDRESEGDSGEEEGLQFPETLPEPLTTNQTIRHLYDLMIDSKIELDPEYQRDVVWDPKRMAGLINSLFNNFYIPPLIFSTSALVRDNDLTQAEIFRVCVDGKQRLTTLRRDSWMEMYAFRRSLLTLLKRKWYYVNTSGSKACHVLDEKIRKEFDQYHILCIEYRRLSRSQEEDLFGRVQMGIPLTPAEKLSASTSPYHKLIHEIKKNCKHVISLLDTHRQKDFQFIAVALLMMRRRDEEDDLAKPIKWLTTGTKVRDMMSKERTIPPSYRLMVTELFDKYDKLVKDYPDVFTHKWVSAKSKKFSPIEFMAVAMMLYTYRNRRISELASDIKAMRHYIRGQAADLRSNTTIWNYVWTFIEEMENDRGAIPFRGVNGTSNCIRNLSPQAKKQAIQSQSVSIGASNPTFMSFRSQAQGTVSHALYSHQTDESARPRKRIRVFDAPQADFRGG